MEAPIFSSCPQDKLEPKDPDEDKTVVEWSDPIANDNSGTSPIVSCSVNSGDRLSTGTTKVTCEARDESGNQATCSFTVEIDGKDIVDF